MMNCPILFNCQRVIFRIPSDSHKTEKIDLILKKDDKQWKIFDVLLKGETLANNAPLLIIKSPTGAPYIADARSYRFICWVSDEPQLKTCEELVEAH